MGSTIDNRNTCDTKIYCTRQYLRMHIPSNHLTQCKYEFQSLFALVSYNYISLAIS